MEAKMANLVMMVGFRTGDSRIYLEEGEEFPCMICKMKVMIAKPSLNQFRNRNCKAICRECFKKEKIKGKFGRPDKEVLDAIRKESGKDIGEPEIRQALSDMASEIRR